MNLNRKKGTFILCFAEWCGYCKKYMSQWQEFKQKYGNEYDFIEANMSDSNNIIAPEKVKPMLKDI
ncbi:thioredoxin family protein, partial [bacterium]|nr:thioredoxin family protein [bacterium]